MDTETLKTNLTSGQHWLRLVYMLLFAVVLYVSAIVMCLVIVLQFLFALIGGSPNANLARFGASLGRYIYLILLFMTYNREAKPFPFSDWPDAEAPVAEPPPATPVDSLDSEPAGEYDPEGDPGPKGPSV